MLQTLELFLLLITFWILICVVSLAIPHHPSASRCQQHEEGEDEDEDEEEGKAGQDPDTMSKLSPTLKALINAPFARPDPTAASSRIIEVYKAIANDANKRNLGLKPWLALSVGPTSHTTPPFRDLFTDQLTIIVRRDIHPQLPRIPLCATQRRVRVRVQSRSR